MRACARGAPPAPAVLARPLPSCLERANTVLKNTPAACQLYTVRVFNMTLWASIVQGMVSLLFFVIFSILGLQLFGGTFWYCSFGLPCDAQLDQHVRAVARQRPLPSSDSSQFPSTCSSLPLVSGCSSVAC